MSRLVAIVDQLTAGWHAVDDLTVLERRPRRTPSLAVDKCVAPSQGICVICTVRTRTLSKGRTSGIVPGLPEAHWACEIVGHVLMLAGFPPIVADTCWFRGTTKRALELGNSRSVYVRSEDVCINENTWPKSDELDPV